MAGTVRKPAVSGQFYPAGKKELAGLVDGCFSDGFFGPGGVFEENPAIVGGIVPHAGLVYSGPCAAAFYSSLPRDMFRTIVILGTNHTVAGSRISIAPWDFWETPLGKVPVNQALAQKLSGTGLFETNPAPHLKEHSIEVQLPFLQARIEKFSILPLIVSSSGEFEELEEAGKALAKLIEPKRTLLLASSDLNHYEGKAETERKDSLAIGAALSLSPEKLWKTVLNERISMCGISPSIVLLSALEALGATKARLVKHYNSGDVIPADWVVGYASVSFLK
ncbi:MAG: AmmeMemoRadiSam system protein B [archaeon]